MPGDRPQLVVIAPAPDRARRRRREHRVGQIERAGARRAVAEHDREQLVVAERAAPESLQLFTRSIVRRDGLHRTPYPAILSGAMPRLSVLLVHDPVLGRAASRRAPNLPRKKSIRPRRRSTPRVSAGAEQYAPEAFAAATTALQQSHEAVDQRDYRLALSRAVDASERAQDAATAAADNKAKARSEAEAAINATNAQVMHLDARLKVADEVRVPPRELAPARATLKDADGTLQKARALLAAGNFAAATTAVTGARFADSLGDSRGRGGDYATDRPPPGAQDS